MKIKTAGLVVLVAMALGGAIAACTGADGANGADGKTGATGAQGPAGSVGPTGLQGPPGGMPDGGLTASCLSPCHGFVGIVEQWKTSTHYAAYVSNIGGDEVPVWTGPQACGNCHAIDALEGRVAGKVGFSGDAGVTNPTKGEISYRSSLTGAVADSTYTGNAKVAAVNCVTCHSVTPQNDPHRTGAVWAPGLFPLRTPTGGADFALLEKSPNTSAVVGTSAGLRGTANACIWCHKSRKDVTNYIGVSNSITSRNWGPHEGPQAEIYTGLGGYHYASKTYGTSTHEQKLTCVDCHMAPVAGNGNAPNHSFYATIGACTSCHVGATNFDVNGGASQFKIAMFELQKALNTAGYLTRSAASPYVALAGTELTDGQFALDKSRSPNTLTADQAGALYNYFLLARGSAMSIHNPKYAKQLLFDSYFAITGLPPTSLARPN